MTYTKEEGRRCIEILNEINDGIGTSEEDRERYKNDMNYRCYVNHMSSAISDVISLIEE